MSWSGGGLYNPWGGGLTSTNYRQPSSNQEQLKREAARRRKAEAANSLAEQRRKAGAINDGEDLFPCPIKTVSSATVRSVLTTNDLNDHLGLCRNNRKCLITCRKSIWIFSVTINLFLNK